MISENCKNIHLNSLINLIAGKTKEAIQLYIEKGFTIEAIILAKISNDLNMFKSALTKLRE